VPRPSHLAFGSAGNLGSNGKLERATGQSAAGFAIGSAERQCRIFLCTLLQPLPQLHRTENSRRLGREREQTKFDADFSQLSGAERSGGNFINKI
jgi:hypothetical protein